MLFEAVEQQDPSKTEKYKKFRISIFHTDRLTINDNNVPQVMLFFSLFQEFSAGQITRYF